MNTASGGMYSGAEGVAPLCTLALTHNAEQLLTTAVQPYVQLLKVYRGRATFQLQHNHTAASVTPAMLSAAAGTPTAAPPAALSISTPTPSSGPSPPRVLVDVQLPASVLSFRVVLLVPQLDAQSYPELLSLLTHLQGCGCELAALTVCCLTAARPALWSVMSVYPTLALLTTAIDEVRHGQLVPGIKLLESRSAMYHTSAKKQPESEDGEAKQAETVQAASDNGDNELCVQADVH